MHHFKLHTIYVLDTYQVCIYTGTLLQIFFYMEKKKKILLSLFLIAAVGGAAIAGTYAYFTARRTVSTNRFATGTLDLNVSSNGQVNEPFVIENLGENANISGGKTWTVKNTGSLPGRLLLRLNDVTNEENGCNDPEKEAEPACESNTEGELGGVITLNVSLDGQPAVSSTLATNQQNKVGTDWNALTPIVLQPNETRTVGFAWATDENAYGNEIQSDSVKFDAIFRLIQQINGPTPTN